MKSLDTAKSDLCVSLAAIRSPLSALYASGDAPRSTLNAPRASGAFTLVELLVVIVVIAILMGITIPVSKYAVARAKAARQEVMLAKIRSALDDYRAAYGEYPITPVTNGEYDRAETLKHYWDNVMPDMGTASNSVFTNVSLSTNTIEVFAAADGIKYSNDYCLTFPLMLRQEREGKRPFMNFDKVTVMHIVYKKTSDGDVRHGTYQQRRRTKTGFQLSTVEYVLGDPVDRVKAIDPVSSLQWKYECRDGNFYTITTNIF